MATEDFKRKLTAVLSADVAGYSRLMGDDEAATVKTLATYREVMASLTKQHRGRVVDSPGDNVLAEFASVVDAVQCAVAVQKEFQARNAELPEKRRMEFRMGINLGDVIEEEDRIYGDGVNIAARLEALADPGGICISKTAFDQIETKLPLGYEYLGEQTVKNIAKPVGAYRVLMEPRVTVAEEIEKVSSEQALGLQLPDKPSIAVLPFINMSEDPKQEYFVDGITRSIITQLYKIPDIFVIHRSTSSTYKGNSVKVQQVGRELGVRYVLEGGVQKAGYRIRINAQLIDAATGENLWAESYDRELKDVFAVQDEITRKVITEMAVKIAWGEMARGWACVTENYEALDLYFQADKLFSRFQKESNIRARELLTKAIELDPKFARAIAFLGFTHMMDVRFGWAKNPAQSMKRAEELAKQAVAINDTDYMGHGLLSRIYTHKRQYEQAIAAGERAVEVEPNNAVAIDMLGFTMTLAGMSEEALVLERKAMRLSPYPPIYFLAGAGDANYLTGRYEAAINEYKKYLKRQQHGGGARRVRHWLIASYMELGREEDARVEAQKLLEQDPNVSVAALIEETKRFPFKDYAFLDRHIELLRKAGLK